jgi:hypothetical protein
MPMISPRRNASTPACSAALAERALPTGTKSACLTSGPRTGCRNRISVSAIEVWLTTTIAGPANGSNSRPESS